MKKQIKNKVGSVEALAELYNTKTAEAIWQGLPFKSEVNTYGDEIYFRIPLEIELEAGREIVELGDSYNPEDYDTFKKTGTGFGGLKSKLESARLVTSAGKEYIIAKTVYRIPEVLSKEFPSTRFI